MISTKTSAFQPAVLLLVVIALPVLTLADPVQVTWGGGHEPAVSPDGNWLLYSASHADLYLMPTSGGQGDSLGISGFDMDWSPQGDSFLYRSSGLFVYDIASGTTSLLNDGNGWDDGPAWSPLGTEIAVQGEPVMLISYPEGELSTVDCMDPDGTDCSGEFPTWSPDGQWIAFEDGMDILKVHRDGGLAEIIVTGLNDVTEPAWSPDGKWVAFAMEGIYPALNIWISDARGTDFGLYQVTFGDFEDASPEWAPDSRSIYFSSNRSGGAEIWQTNLPALSSVPSGNSSLASSLAWENPGSTVFFRRVQTEFRSELAAEVTASVFDLRGRLVRNLGAVASEPGLYTLDWDGRDHNGRRTSRGIYFLRIAGRGANATMKFVLVR